MISQTVVEQLRQDIGNVSSTVDERQIRQKSHDFHWYSPVLTRELQNCLADVVVQPKSEDEIAAVVTAAVRHRIPLTLRGGGTGNYGQSVPLKGGVLLEMTGVNKIVAVEPGSIRIQAGAVIHSALEAALASGQQLMMYPSTMRSATIGGYLGGGFAGIGSVRHGIIRDFRNDPVSQNHDHRGHSENSDALRKRCWFCFSFLGHDRNHPGGSAQAGAG